MKRAIELKVLLQVEVPDHFTEEQAKFFIEENHCRTNYVDAMAAAIKNDDKDSVCNLCPFASATLLAPTFPVEKAFDAKRS